MERSSFKGETISITFKEDEKWEATFNYGFCRLFNMAGPSNECTTYAEGRDNALSLAEELDVKASQKEDSITFRANGYQLLESLLNRSKCCESADIEVRTVDGVRKTYFSLDERSDHTLNKWSVTVYGEEILSSNKDDFKWTKEIAGWSEYDESESLSSDPPHRMDAVLIETADNTLFILGSILVVILVVSGLSFTAHKIFGWNIVKKVLKIAVGAVIGAMVCGLVAFVPVVVTMGFYTWDCSYHYYRRVSWGRYCGR
jgi:hypothetical protein